MQQLKGHFRRPVVTVCMSRRRFDSIKRALYCQDYNEPQEWEGQPRKIGIVLRLFTDACSEFYVVGENCAVDEVILKFKGTLRMKFTRLSKPTREDLKIFALCESGTGYVVCASLDQRCQKTIEQTVLDLVHVVSGDWRTVYMDNSLTGVSLLKKMLEVETDV